MNGEHGATLHAKFGVLIAVMVLVQVAAGVQVHTYRNSWQKRRNEPRLVQVLARYHRHAGKVLLLMAMYNVTLGAKLLLEEKWQRRGVEGYLIAWACLFGLLEARQQLRLYQNRRRKALLAQLEQEALAAQAAASQGVDDVASGEGAQGRVRRMTAKRMLSTRGKDPASAKAAPGDQLSFVNPLKTAIDKGNDARARIRSLSGSSVVGPSGAVNNAMTIQNPIAHSRGIAAQHIASVRPILKQKACTCCHKLALVYVTAGICTTLGFSQVPVAKDHVLIVDVVVCVQTQRYRRKSCSRFLTGWRWPRRFRS